MELELIDPLNCRNCITRNGCRPSADDSYAGTLSCVIRRCCGDDLPYDCLPQPDCLQALRLEGHAGSDWGFIDATDALDEESETLVADELACMTLKVFAELLFGVATDEPFYPQGFGLSSIGDSFALVTTTRDTSETCPFVDECEAHCSGKAIPDNDSCRLLGRHPLLVPIQGDDVALQVSWLPGGPVFDQIDLRPVMPV